MKKIKLCFVICFILFTGIAQCETKEEIIIVPIGKVDRSIITELCKKIVGKFKAKVGISTALETPMYAYNPEKGQFSSTLILQRLYYTRGGGKYKIVGIINENLYDENPISVGVANKNISLISLKNLKDGIPKETYCETIATTLIYITTIHEIAHLYGLDHCRHKECVMYETCNMSTKGYIVNTDFCPACKALLDRRMSGL